MKTELAQASVRSGLEERGPQQKQPRPQCKLRLRHSLHSASAGEGITNGNFCMSIFHESRCLAAQRSPRTSLLSWHFPSFTCTYSILEYESASVLVCDMARRASKSMHELLKFQKTKSSRSGTAFLLRAHGSHKRGERSQKRKSLRPRPGSRYGPFFPGA